MSPRRAKIVGYGPRTLQLPLGAWGVRREIVEVIVILRLGGDIFLVGKTAATFFGVTDCVTKALFSER
jgi:hypothetical protein